MKVELRVRFARSDHVVAFLAPTVLPQATGDRALPSVDTEVPRSWVALLMPASSCVWEGN